jgi:putative flippase GtrA
MVGVVGFLVDSFFLYLLKGDMGLYFGRLISFSLAAYATWVLNRLITFRDRSSDFDKKKELAIYLILMVCGGSVSYAIYAGLITFSPFALQYPILAVGVGGLGGLVVNFITSNLLFKS